MSKSKIPPDSGERARMWELKQEAARPGVLQLYIYGYVEPDTYDWFGDRIASETSANHFREALAEYPDAREIEIYINSLGGSVMEGTAIYNQLRRHPAHKTVYVDGFAASIASVIAMAGDEVIMPANTLMMIHNMTMVAWGNPAQLRKAADDLQIINDTGREAYLSKAGDKLTPERLAEMMDAETWLPARECVELGLADRLADEHRAEESGEGAPQQRSGAVLMAMKAMGFDRLTARVTEAEARAARAEAALQEAEKQAQERAGAETSGGTAQADNATQASGSGTEDGKEADGGDAGAGGAKMSIMGALCGLK
jgi:ATP-dependent protease ClpP protease subunit